MSKKTKQKTPLSSGVKPEDIAGLQEKLRGFEQRLDELMVLLRPETPAYSPGDGNSQYLGLVIDRGDILICRFQIVEYLPEHITVQGTSAVLMAGLYAELRDGETLGPRVQSFRLKMDRPDVETLRKCLRAETPVEGLCEYFAELPDILANSMLEATADSAVFVKLCDAREADGDPGEHMIFLDGEGNRQVFPPPEKMTCNDIRKIVSELWSI